MFVIPICFQNTQVFMTDFVGPGGDVSARAGIIGIYFQNFSDLDLPDSFFGF
jgi:hypothetical protein